MASRVQKQIYDRRIVSIVKSHLLIFGTDLLGFNLGSLPAYQAILDFNDKAPRDLVQRALSIVRANEALFEEGLLIRKKGLGSDYTELEDYLLSLLEVQKRELARTNIVPHTLGLSFLRKRFGVPLFGYHRPERVPTIRGVLLSYQSMAADGIGRIKLVLLDESSHIRYKNLGIEMDSDAPSLHCVIADQTEIAYPGTLVPKAAFMANRVSRYTFDSRVAVLSASKKKSKVRNKILDPLQYQYAYFFIADAHLSSKLTRFLLDLFSGSFSFHEREAEPLVAEIIQKAL